MNDHLKPIFEIVIPRLEKANIAYWVYGGVGYASMVGRFYRKNTDVDLFVLENEFEKVEALLEHVCKEGNWKTCKSFNRFNRPKIELYAKRRERCSVIPVYKANSYVSFKFSRRPKDYPLDILTPVKRKLESFEFHSPQDNFLKQLLLDYLGCKKKYPNKDKRIEDARHILSQSEFEKYFPNECYEANL